MSRASRARRIATAAAYRGGGIGAVGALGGAAFYGLIVGQTRLARRRIPTAVGAAPPTDGTTWTAAGVSVARPPIRMAMLGDSLAAGYGVHRDRDTPSVRLAIGISSVARRPVHVSNVAVVGAESRGLAVQLDVLARRGPAPELAVVMVGANDVTHRIKPAESVAMLAAAVTRLRAAGAEVVVGTCPDLGTIRPIGQPLRWIARRMSRNLAAAQTIAVVEAGGRTVSLGDLLGPLFASSSELFSDDRFHPSAAGYAAAADAVLPSALDALGLRTRARAATALSTRRARPLARAAAKAVAVPGTEVLEAAPASGRRPLTRWRHALHRRSLGPLVVLRRRRPQTGLRTAADAARPVSAPALAVAAGDGSAAENSSVTSSTPTR